MMATLTVSFGCGTTAPATDRKVVKVGIILTYSGADASIGEAIDRQHQLEMLAESVRALPARCRHVLTLRLLYGYSQKEISEQLGISPHTVKAQLAKGMRRCADYFAERGLTPYVLTKPDQQREV